MARGDREGECCSHGMSQVPEHAPCKLLDFEVPSTLYPWPTAHAAARASPLVLCAKSGRSLVNTLKLSILNAGRTWFLCRARCCYLAVEH